LGQKLTLTTSDKHTLGAYRADPAGQPKGAIVVIQEIFGVNHHIRAMCDRFAGIGYAAIAPAVFDRFVRDFECGYTPDEIAHARSYLGNLNFDNMMKDITAALDNVKGVGPAGIVGYCMGGTASFLGACRVPGFKAAVSYYGGMIGKFADEKPKCPLMMHFGEKDEAFRWRRSRTSRRNSRRPRPSPTRMHRTASPATSAAHSARGRATLPGSAPPTSSPSI